MSAKRKSWSSKLFCLCIVLAPLAFAGPLRSDPVYTSVGQQALSINDNGAVTGVYPDGSGFLRTPDGVITLFKPAEDATFTLGTSINANDDIAGYFAEPHSSVHGFIRSAAGTFTIFDVPGATDGTLPFCITASGTVFGYIVVGAGARAFVRAPDGTITVIGANLGGNTKLACANDQDVAVGTAWLRTDAVHGLIRSAQGKLTIFDVPNSTCYRCAAAIDNNGAITGDYLGADGVVHGYIRSANGTFTTFDAPGGITQPAAINSKGEIAGSTLLSGFVREPDGTITTFKVPGAKKGTYPKSINNSGVIAGTAWVKAPHGGITTFGFIRTP